MKVKSEEHHDRLDVNERRVKDTSWVSTLSDKVVVGGHPKKKPYRKSKFWEQNN